MCVVVVIWPYTTVPVALFYEVGGTGTLFASNQRCSNTVYSLASQGTLTTESNAKYYLVSDIKKFLFGTNIVQ